jgi:hypothetical protein
MSICSIHECGGKVVGFGYCMKHYRRFKRNGSTDLNGKAAPGDVLEWLQRHVAYSGGRCLIFPFARNDRGYGLIGFGNFYRAHRWMCHAAHGDAPSGKPFALHSCGRGCDGCVNPGHLYWGSSADNYQDQVLHGVAAVGARHGKAKLTEGKVRQIRRLSSMGKSYAEIAAEIGSHHDAVRSVLRGRCWRWVA